MAMRVVAGNWKMNLGPRSARDFVRGLELPDGDEPAVVLFPPAISVASVLDELAEGGFGERVAVGVQNVHYEDAGAFTGEISAPMAAEAGAAYALVGHSERRHVFGEGDQDARRKVDAVLRSGLLPVLCVGETLPERREGRLQEILLRQLDAVLDSGELRARISAGRRPLLAYEPVWAIGTGETATPEDAAEAHGLLRQRLGERLGEGVAERVPILYGGSVKPENAGELMAAPGVDGVLVGGASLDPASFARIVASAG